ncbi:MAG: serine/threonine protein kinase [Planctomycetaceae bacterium]|nr:serine/threonine protein kinase [Planctomycetaceae bacterium]
MQENVWQLAANTTAENRHPDEADKEDCSTKNLEGITIGTYELQTLIGMGGFGTVYRAVNAAASLPRLKYVAVKILRSVATPVSHKAWKLETDALRSMSHPGIVALLDCGITEMGIAWLAMELIDGVPVDSFCKENLVGWSAVVHLMTQVCDAVEHAHSHGILHRDLKPSNILIRSDGSPVVADFGLVHFLPHDSAVSITLTLAGTPAYMAPEQILNCITPTRLPVSAAIDVFGLGATLYSLLCGRPPRSRSFPLHAVAHTLANTPIPRGHFKTI